MKKKKHVRWWCKLHDVMADCMVGMLISGKTVLFFANVMMIILMVFIIKNHERVFSGIVEWIDLIAFWWYSCLG